MVSLFPLLLLNLTKGNVVDSWYRPQRMYLFRTQIPSLAVSYPSRDGTAASQGLTWHAAQFLVPVIGILFLWHQPTCPPNFMPVFLDELVPMPAAR